MVEYNPWFRTSDFPHPSAQICEICNSIESTGTILKWYWDEDYNLHLLCEQCVQELNNEK